MPSVWCHEVNPRIVRSRLHELGSGPSVRTTSKDANFAATPIGLKDTHNVLRAQSGRSAQSIEDRIRGTRIADPTIAWLSFTSDQRRWGFLPACPQPKPGAVISGQPLHISEVILGDEVPRSLADALGHHLPEEHLQFHTGGGDVSSPIYHAQGAGEDDVKPEPRKFLSLLDEGLKKYLGHTQAPLVLAGVDYLKRERGSMPWRARKRAPTDSPRSYLPPSMVGSRLCFSPKGLAMGS
jgi:hypothetical protein